MAAVPSTATEVVIHQLCTTSASMLIGRIQALPRSSVPKAVAGWWPAIGKWFDLMASSINGSGGLHCPPTWYNSWLPTCHMHVRHVMFHTTWLDHVTLNSSMVLGPHAAQKTPHTDKLMRWRQGQNKVMIWSAIWSMYTYVHVYLQNAQVVVIS